MKCFWIVMLIGNPGITIDYIQSRFALDSIQWCRIANNVWIIHTERQAQELTSLLTSMASPSGNYFCSRLNMLEYNGRLPQIAWDWIAAKSAGE